MAIMLDYTYLTLNLCKNIQHLSGLTQPEMGDVRRLGQACRNTEVCGGLMKPSLLLILC